MPSFNQHSYVSRVHWRVTREPNENFTIGFDAGPTQPDGYILGLSEGQVRDLAEKIMAALSPCESPPDVTKPNELTLAEELMAVQGQADMISH